MPTPRLIERLALLPLVLALAQCSMTHEGPGPTSGGTVRSASELPQIINVSAYDPKERQREGRGYSEHDVSALQANGATALIARAGKGGVLDDKCAAFLASADREGMLPGIYYRLQNHLGAVEQARQFVDRAEALARSRSWDASSLLLCGDFDAKSKLSDILAFMNYVESRTGRTPVAYLENSDHLKRVLSTASATDKAKLRRMPYWLALYSHDRGVVDPAKLLDQYGVWTDWTMWQYGGVEYANGRSHARVYHHDPWRFSPYFGDLDRPLERNVFHGTRKELETFWQRHGLPLR